MGQSVAVTSEPKRHDGRKLLAFTQNGLVKGLVKCVIRKHLPVTRHLEYEFFGFDAGSDIDCKVRMGDINVEVKYRFPDSFKYARRDLLMEVIHRTDLLTPGWSFYSNDDYLLVLFDSGQAYWLVSLYHWRDALHRWFEENLERYETTERAAYNYNLQGKATETRNYHVPLEDIPAEFKVIECLRVDLPPKDRANYFSAHAQNSGFHPIDNV